MTNNKYTFDIDMPDDFSAGLRGFSDTVHIIVESGEPGGDDGEFEDYIFDWLKDWYDGAKVTWRDQDD